MHFKAVLLVAGDVATMHDRTFIVLRTTDEPEGGKAVCVEVLTRGDAHHRADVAPGHWSDFAEAGISSALAVAACGRKITMPARGPIKLGRVSPAMLERLLIAFHTEGGMQRYEEAFGRGDLSAGGHSSIVAEAMVNEAGFQRAARRPGA